MTTVLCPVTGLEVKVEENRSAGNSFKYQVGTAEVIAFFNDGVFNVHFGKVEINPIRVNTSWAANHSDDINGRLRDPDHFKNFLAAMVMAYCEYNDRQEANMVSEYEF